MFDSNIVCYCRHMRYTQQDDSSHSWWTCVCSHYINLCLQDTALAHPLVSHRLLVFFSHNVETEGFPLDSTQLGRFRLHSKCDGTRAETRFRLSAKRTSPFNSAGASVQSTTSSRGVRTSGSNARYTLFRGSVKSTGYPLLSPRSPSLPLT